MWYFTIRLCFYCVTSNRLSFLILCWLWTLPHRSKYVCTFIAYSRVTWLVWHIEQEPFNIIPCRKHLKRRPGSQPPAPPCQPVWQDVYSVQLRGTLTCRISALSFKSRPERESQNCSFIITSLSKAVMGRSTNLTIRVSFDI